MAGGTWLNQNKTLPGVYTNFTADGGSITVGRPGRVSLALSLSWLDEKTIIRLTKDNFPNYLGFSGASELPIREAFKNANEILLYRLNTGTKATAALGNLTVTAKYSGIYGNTIRVSISSVVDDEGKFYVSTYLDTSEVDKQKVSDASELKSNKYVDFSSGEEKILATNAGTTLTAGTDGAVTNADYIAYLQALELYEFDAVACISADSDVKTLYTDFAKRLINDDGRYFQLVCADVSTDFEAVISVKNGIILEDGQTVSTEIACSYIAGATAAVPLSSSLTNAEYIGAADVTERFSKQRQIDLCTEGQIAFIPSLDSKVYIQKDISNRTTVTEDRTAIYKKNKTIRTIYAIANEIYLICNTRFIGKVSNSDDGRNLLKSAILSYLKSLSANYVIGDISPDDIGITKGTQSDSVVITYAIRPIDTIEVIYNTIVLSE